ncbi:DUF3826 domain-containing protein [uncultured Draconibacterium sp.]|uniref:DUF3826 domain-containing protein n=1 Tax=uncultured Draconibacterium sp. TaxID=1573823 RepID=UPI0032166B10
MKKLALCFVVLFFFVFVAEAQTYEDNFSKPLGKVLQDIGTQFEVRLKYDVDTVGKVVPFADFRIRPYSLEESLTNVLSLFDYKFVKQNDKLYKIKSYEYPRRTPADGEKMLAYLNTLYSDSTEWNQRKACLRKEVREILQIDPILAKRVKAKPTFSESRNYDGYSVQNFSLETLPGLYVCGSVYRPLKDGKHPLIICPNGHWGNGRYNTDLQYRFGTLACMGATCVSYDLFGWGESVLQVTGAAHRTSVAHVVQIMNGLTLLDYMLTLPDIDATKVAANGGSGGGAQTVLLSILDDRFAAACPTVSLSSHFDGGCPCESGMPITLACGGTNNAEMMAAFAPKPLCVISDGQDWTASVPDLELPYLKRIYGFYDASDEVSNVHIPDEGHSFGINKRNGVYDFFIKTFGLDANMLDESKVQIESQETMLSFGENGQNMPANAIRSFDEVEKMFDKVRDENVNAKLESAEKAKKWAATLALNDAEKEARIEKVLYTHLYAVRQWDLEHPYSSVPAGINPQTGKELSKLDLEMIASSSKPKSVHEDLMNGLRNDLNEEQVEQVLDMYTIGKVAFTMKAYREIVPDMTMEEENTILANLKEAREMAVDYKSMKQISAIFEIYKTKNEQYLDSNGRSWRKMYSDYVKALKAKKAAQAKSTKK